MAGHQAAPVLLFADQLVAGRAVGNNGGPRQCISDAGRIGDPQVLTDLAGHDKFGNFTVLEEQACSKPCGLSQERYLTISVLGGAKPPLLIKFLIVGQMLLGNNTKNRALVDNHGTVVEISLNDQGGAENQQQLTLLACFNNCRYCLEAACLQRLLQEQIGTGIGAGDQFRKHKQAHLLLFGLTHEKQYRLGVEQTIGNLDVGRGDSTLDKPVFHSRFSLRSRTATASWWKVWG
ncbi:hypothetical protein DSECCO2_512370 [anaerobic digester metagenome]